MEDIGAEKTRFEIVLDKEWQQGKYILGYDPYEPEDSPINLYNTIKKILGLKYKKKETESKAVVCKLWDNGVIEHINSKL